MNRPHPFYHGRALARRLCLVFILVLLTLLLPEASVYRASAATNVFAPSPALKCKTQLSDVELPNKFDTFTGHTSRNNALNWLNQNFSINTAGKLLRFFKTRGEFDKLLAPQFLAPESLAIIALRAELQCILPNVSHNHRDLLDSAMSRSLYKLGKIDPQDNIQITALRHYLEKIAIAKGRPYYDEEQQILDMPAPDDLRNWIGTARVTPPAIRTCEDKKNQPKAENCLVFQDGSTYDFPPPAKDAPPPQIVIPARCIKLSAQSWDDEGLILNTLNAPSALRLDVNLIHPPDDPSYELMVHDPNDNGVLLRRMIRGKHRTTFVFSAVAQAYRLRLKAVPVDAKLCWEEIAAQPIGAGETQTTITVPLADKEFRYYAYDAVCTDIVIMTLTANAGDTGYYVRAPIASGLTPVVAATISPPSGTVPIPTYFAGTTCSSPPNPRRFLIALGHFENVQDPCTPGITNPCRTLASALQVAPPHASEIKLTLQKTSTLETFYTARISQMTWSNDQEDVLWEGEINSYASVRLQAANDSASKTKPSAWTFRTMSIAKPKTTTILSAICQPSILNFLCWAFARVT